MELYYGDIATPIGTLTILSDGESIVRIDFGAFTEVEAKWQKWISRYFGDPVFSQKPDKVADAATQLRDYFLGKRQDFTLDLAFYGTAFQQQVWEALNDIPYGHTKTYRDIAEAINNPKAVRAVGGAVNKNPFSIAVPCHRVIGADDSLVGYGGGLDKKEYLLSLEKQS